MQPPVYIPFLAAFALSLFICVTIHLIIRGRSLLRSNGPASSNSAEMDPSNCVDLIRNQITMVQTFPHPSAAGRQNVTQLSELLLTARLYHPSSKTQLTAFAERLPSVYEDEGLFLMALLELHKWVNGNLHTPELS